MRKTHQRLKAVSDTPVIFKLPPAHGRILRNFGVPMSADSSNKARPNGLGQEEFGLKDRLRGTGGPTNGEMASQ